MKTRLRHDVSRDRQRAESVVGRRKLERVIKAARKAEAIAQEARKEVREAAHVR